jgi:hypothetical protein
MTETPPAWRTDLSLIVPHPGAPSFLVLPDAAGWRLPALHFDKRMWLPDVAPLSAAVEAELGLRATILRSADVLLDREQHQLTAIIIVEPLRADWQPPVGSRWVSAAELAELELAQPEQRPALERYFTELTEAPPLRPPWAVAGWYASAVVWIEAQLTRLGYTLSAPVEQIKSCGLSCVLRAQTSAGAVYFKISPPLPLFAAEPQIVAALATRYPALVPTPLAIDAERSWLLLADLGAELRAQPDPALWTAAFSAHGQMQRGTVGDIAWLRANGCVDRSLERLAAQIDPLLASDEVRRMLKPDEIAQLRAVAPELRERCAELMRSGPPPTLVHGDLHGGNIALRDGRLSIFDWTDACVGHPFIDLPVMMWDITDVFPDPAVQAAIRDSYLAQWTEYGSLEQLQAMWTLAEPLIAMHHAVSYHAIVTNMEPAERHILDMGMPHWLRRTLEILSAQQSA